MHLLMFGGNSPRNRNYIYEAQKELADICPDSYVQDYEHWETGQEWINLPNELAALKAHKPTGDYGLVAKSIGTVLAVQAIKQGIIAPKFLLLLGIPLAYITKDYPEFAAELEAANIQTVILHNADDPVGKATDVLDYLTQNTSDLEHINFITTEGKTHDYEDYELIRTELKQSLKYDKINP